LVDADLRRPSVAKQLGLESKQPGLTNLVNGSASLSDCAQSINGSDLHVITSGVVPRNPLELMLSERFQQTLASLGNSFDILVIDSPPVHTVSDARVLSTMANVVLFVVKADGTPYQLARRCIEA